MADKEFQTLSVQSQRDALITAERASNQNAFLLEKVSIRSIIHSSHASVKTNLTRRPDSWLKREVMNVMSCFEILLIFSYCILAYS